MRTDVLRHEFVEFIPGILEEGVLYIFDSVRHGGAPVLQWLWREGGHAINAHRLEAHLRR